MRAPQETAGFILDVDGCVVRGDRPIPGVPEALAALRARGRRYVFLTNDNEITPAQMVAKLNRMGIPADRDNVLTSAMIAADVTATLYAGRKVFGIGGRGVTEALQARGVTLLDRRQAAEAEVVVMGKDPDFNQGTLELICQAIWNGAEFIATNDDAKVPATTGFIPASGPMVKAVAYATGKEPLVTGKPSRWAVGTALTLLGIAPEQGAVAGDQLEQDIRMGKESGLFTILVLTGVGTMAAAAAAPEDRRPDLILPDLSALPAWLDGRL